MGSFIGSEVGRTTGTRVGGPPPFLFFFQVFSHVVVGMQPLVVCLWRFFFQVNKGMGRRRHNGRDTCSHVEPPPFPMMNHCRDLILHGLRKSPRSPSCHVQVFLLMFWSFMSSRPCMCIIQWIVIHVTGRLLFLQYIIGTRDHFLCT